MVGKSKVIVHLKKGNTVKKRNLATLMVVAPEGLTMVPRFCCDICKSGHFFQTMMEIGPNGSFVDPAE